ncbi:TRAP transporter large permease [Nitratireductor indicus]|uniref:TRAP transporter large permease protein n=1 Tax=Nitratireductor indicus C115 TaxID=1231190 RepID=K2N9I5_9HYPH|nr:TRAP transporter large permease [Nitratireductor indicus]EKF44178.1 TRAP-type C4-dicarboxylate transport system, large permease component [Nitratireductor indicus C115]MDS1137136.1 TRAP transporter large permease [Nitratireductor indicus]SFQ24804.1 C4-dicarboxylate transporter, DctM subunit [Nitratireductor indicus]
MGVASIPLILAVLLATGVPIAATLGLVTLYGLSARGIPLVSAIQSMFASLDSFSLMAVPFYILAGNIMQAGGISDRLVRLTNAMVGWLRGGLGAAAVLTSMIFACISGSSSATTAAVGATTIPAMAKKGYPKPFAASLVASSGELGAIIPPSLPMIIYGLVTNVSIGALFIAGIIPGLMIGGSLVALVFVWAAIRGFDHTVSVSPAEWARGVTRAFGDSILSLFMPVLILGGIYSGIFTPTEASVVAVAYGLFVSMAVYREISWREMSHVFIRSALTSAGILLIVAVAAAFGFVLTINRIPHQVGQWIASVAQDPVSFLILVNVLLLVVGMFLETLAAIVILAPILAPVAVSYGISPIHFGIVMIVNLAIGMLTPPIGVNLFIASEVAGLKIEKMIRALLVFIAVLITNLALISYLPILSTILL